MLRKAIIFFGILILSWSLLAQDDEQQNFSQKLNESIELSLENFRETLKTEDWQEFYLDSILRHNYTEMNEELGKLRRAKVSNSDIYLGVQDKWMEANYQAFKKVFNETQWAKYLKMGADKEKKARDKRAAAKTNKKK